MEISPKFYKRWTNIYMTKGAKEGWAVAKQWAARTLTPNIIDQLKPYIQDAMGMQTKGKK